MFGNGITFSGLASGLDTRAIIDALINAERVPIQILEARKEDNQEKIGLVGTLEGHVKALQEAAKQLATLDSFYAYTVAASDPAAATITVGSTAAAGAHTLDVLSLASSARVAFAGVADKTAVLTSGAGAITFEYGGQTETVNLAAGLTLEQVAAEINGQAGTAVTASVVNTGPQSSPSYQLVLAGKATGAAFDIENLSSSVAELSSFAVLSAAEDAVAVIDGLTVNRETNDFSDVVPGVNIQVQAVTPGPETFTVGADVEAIKANLTAFVDAYNAVADFVAEQSKYTEEEGAGGLLFGDSVLSSTMGALRSALFSQTSAEAQADTTGFSTLSLIGIKLDNGGRLTIDETKLGAKLDENLAAVADLFADTDGFDNGGLPAGSFDYYVDTTADKGLADALARAIDKLTKPVSDPAGPLLKGLFQLRTEALNEQIENFDRTIETRELQLERYEERLTQQFTALEELMGQLNSQQAFLDQQLSNLNG